jgi:hypothetical protein
MTVIENEEIKGQSFVLEEVSFINCKLVNCHLFYSGGEFEWINTTFVDCGFHFRGAAKNTQALFQLFGMLKEGQPSSPPPMSQKIQ